VVERWNQSIVAMAWCIMKTKKLPRYFWGEAVSIAVYILNRSLTRTVDGKTPYETWHGETLAVYYLHTFGCLAHVKDTRLNLNKLEDHISKCIIIGYEPGSKAYWCYDPAKQRVIVSRDIVFDEAGRWGWHTDDAGQEVDVEPFIIEYITEVVHAPTTTLLPTPRATSAPPLPLLRQRGLMSS
jgi:hypothetical protein